MKLRHILLVAAVLSCARVALAGEPPTNQELLDQLQVLRSRVAQLEAQQSGPTAEQVDQIVDRVLTDARSRSYFLADNAGLTAGHDQGRFFIRSDDGNWLLMPGFVFQARYVANFSHDDDETEAGFEVRRMKLIFEGNAISPQFQYKFQWETTSSTGDLFLQDAWVRYRFTDNLALEVGQFKDGIHHEEAMPDQFTLTADRSYANAILGGGNIDRIQGVMLMYDNKKNVHVNLVVHDGANTKNTTFEDEGGGSNFGAITDMDCGVSLRAEYLVMGTWKQYDDFTALGNKEDLLAVGAGVNWSHSGDQKVLFHTVDAQYENATGLALYGAFLGIWRQADFSAAVPDPTGDHYDFGGLVQAGQMITDKIEAFGRYEYLNLDDGLLIPGTEDTLHVITIGANYYLSRHNVKFTADIQWLPNGSPFNVPGVGVLQSRDEELVLRLQAQLVL